MCVCMSYVIHDRSFSASVNEYLYFYTIHFTLYTCVCVCLCVGLRACAVCVLVCVSLLVCVCQEYVWVCMSCHTFSLLQHWCSRGALYFDMIHFTVYTFVCVCVCVCVCVRYKNICGYVTSYIIVVSAPVRASTCTLI